MAAFPAQPIRRLTLDDLRGTPFAAAALTVMLAVAALGVLVAAGWMALAALVVGIAVVMATLAEPRYGLYMAVLSVPAQQYVAVRGLTWTQASFLLVFGSWLIGQAIRGARWEWLRDPVLWCFLAFYGVILSSAWVAGDVGATVAEGWRWGEALVVYAIARAELTTRRAWAGLLATICVGAGAEAFVGSVQSKLHLGNASFAFSAAFSRAFGTFGRPNSYAAYLEMVFPVALAVAVWAVAVLPGRIAAWWHTIHAPLPVERAAARALLTHTAVLAGIGLSAVFALAGIFFSFSRGAWVGVAAGVIVMMLLAGRRAAVAVSVLTVLLALFLALGGGTYLPDSLQQRLGSVSSSLILLDYDRVPITDANFAVKERMAYWFGGLRMAADHPWRGVGLGNYGREYDARYFTSPFMKSQVHAHNYYIHITAETGIIGLAAYLVLIGALLVTGIQATQRTRHDPFARAIATGITGVIVAVAVHNLFEDLHVLSLGVHLSALWGVLSAIHTTSRLPPLPRARDVR